MAPPRSGIMPAGWRSFEARGTEGGALELTKNQVDASRGATAIQTDPEVPPTGEPPRTSVSSER